MSDIRLNVSGIAYTGWTSIQIQQSLDQICGSFGFATSDKFPDKPSSWKIKMGDYCTVTVDDTTVASGYIDDMPIDYDAENHSIQISGRDKTCDLVDCDFVGGVNEWNDQTILKLIQNLCTPYDIDVTTDSTVASDVTTIIPKFVAEEGATVSELIRKLCMHKAILPISLGDGKLTLTRAGSSRSSDRLVQSVNILAGHLDQSNRDRYSNYIAKGQGEESSLKKLLSSTEPEGEATDDVINRYRTKVFLMDGNVDSGKCKNHANFEARMRAGQSRAIEYTVQGWTQSTGTPWKLNSLVRVSDDFFGVKATKLIAGITYTYNNDDGEIASIRLVDKEAYEYAEVPITGIKSKWDDILG